MLLCKRRAHVSHSQALGALEGTGLDSNTRRRLPLPDTTSGRTRQATIPAKHDTVGQQRRALMRAPCRGRDFNASLVAFVACGSRHSSCRAWIPASSVGRASRAQTRLQRRCFRLHVAGVATGQTIPAPIRTNIFGPPGLPTRHLPNCRCCFVYQPYLVVPIRM